MSVETYEVDYLIIGAGAMGMAFADTILTESDKTVLIVDMHHRPGGHWNDAYPFVTLHQPSAYYGVSSKELSKGRKDETGLNKGLQDLATGPEIMAYFDEVMRYQFLPTGRVTYLSMCKYEGEGKISALMSDKTYQVKVREKTVDATWLKTTVPSTHTPSFEIAEGVKLIPLNDLPKVTQQPSNYVVVGGGKTGIDAVIWLLENHVDPDMIRWVRPRDAWLMDRANTQPSDEFFMATMGAQAAQMQAIAESESVTDLFDRLEASGVFVRIDKSIRPQMMHGATISQAELEELRRVKDVIRMGRIKRIGLDEIILDEGALNTTPDTLYVDCSACAVGNMEERPIFEGDTLYLQTVRVVQPVFSAAFIAHIDLTRDNDEEKNRLCQIVPLPNHDTDWLRMQAAFMMNQYTWSQEKDLRDWTLNNRLDGYSRMVANVKPEETEKVALLKSMRANSMAAVLKLQNYIAELA
ncbi:MAG: NAD(P)-binding protein [Henriciella sp.]|nr:NAD(P)-binding protein [Henriciella sp.]